MLNIVNDPLLHGLIRHDADASAAVWLNTGLDPTCATCAGKPHVLLECRLQLHFDSGSGALSGLPLDLWLAALLRALPCPLCALADLAIIACVVARRLSLRAFEFVGEA